MSTALPVSSSPLPLLPVRDLKKIRKDPAKTAEAVGLHYIDCKIAPGYTRKRAGKGYYYVDDQGVRCRDKKKNARFKALVLPPAWEDVWISKDPKAHLQATGIDEAGRKQYRYHEHWNQIRNATKYFKLLRFVAVLPDLREQVQHDLRSHGYTCAKATALAVRLMEKTCIRVGNLRYRIKNGTSGLTTLDARQVQVKGSTIQLKFTGKKSIKHHISLRDRSLARLITHYKEMPGKRLFQYFNSENERKPLQAHHVNEYIREHTCGSFTAKDFRTWMGTVTAFEYLRQQEPPTSEAALKRTLNACFDEVAEHLGNTRAVCKKYYVHPSVTNAYADNRLQKYTKIATSDESWLSESEQRVAKLLASYH
jgi:DNA topoisomerase I